MYNSSKISHQQHLRIKNLIFLLDIKLEQNIWIKNIFFLQMTIMFTTRTQTNTSLFFYGKCHLIETDIFFNDEHTSSFKKISSIILLPKNPDQNRFSVPMACQKKATKRPGHSLKWDRINRGLCVMAGMAQ